jgi:putative aldouronate transport system substrate-binding protein
MVDGKPVFTDLVLNDTEGYGSIYAIWGDYLWNITKRWYDWQRELLPSMSEETLNAGPFWDQNFKDEYTLPSAALSISTEDSAKYSSIINDANTFINESVAKFITGATPLSEYDSFIATLKGMGVEDAVALMQDSYDRFMKR